MTYCLGIITHDGLVLASDSRTNAGYDQVNVSRKMYSFVQPGKSVFILLTSGNLSLAQSVVTLLRQDFNEGQGLASAGSLYDAARVVGEQIRHVDSLDGEALRRDEMKFNVSVIVGGQVRGQKHGLMMVYPQGNPIHATKDNCFLQIGEAKYGKPILDRGLMYHRTTLADASKYALLSMDATIRSNVTVGPPIDLMIYHKDEMDITIQRRLNESDPDLQAIHSHWEQSLRRAVAHLPDIDLSHSHPCYYVPKPKDGVIQKAMELNR